MQCLLAVAFGKMCKVLGLDPVRVATAFAASVPRVVAGHDVLLQFLLGRQANAAHGTPPHARIGSCVRYKQLLYKQVSEKKKKLVLIVSADGLHENFPKIEKLHQSREGRDCLSNFPVVGNMRARNVFFSHYFHVFVILFIIWHLEQGSTYVCIYTAHTSFHPLRWLDGCFRSEGLVYGQRARASTSRTALVLTRANKWILSCCVCLQDPELSEKQKVRVFSCPLDIC